MKKKDQLSSQSPIAAGKKGQGKTDRERKRPGGGPALQGLETVPGGEEGTMGVDLGEKTTPLFVVNTLGEGRDGSPHQNAG